MGRGGERGRKGKKEKSHIDIGQDKMNIHSEPLIIYKQQLQSFADNECVVFLYSCHNMSKLRRKGEGKELSVK